MTDKELLEAAAKAAGVKTYAWWEEMDTFTLPDGNWWNPLKSDGDAFRLAVDLGISIKFGYCEDDAPVVWCSHEFDYRERHGNFPDPYAATRRAIVIAAANLANAEPHT